MMYIKFIILFLFCFSESIAQQGQIAISRIDLMPDQPTPYNIRDWKKVALQYDSFIYNKDLTGQYLPIVSYTSNGINYPSQKQIRLHTYIGTNSPQNSEAINVMPSLVGAALIGQDIRNLYGVDRLVMSQDFYNKANGENIYLNNASAGSGGDWWYDVMPNVYFYQLYDLFPSYNQESDIQFESVAEKFLEATRKMGGNATPWTPASMNYRAWNFKTMVGNANGVKEPETAGTFGWLLYHAYLKTKNIEFLKGAEWSMEYLGSLNSNPSYELQLPYGAYIGAKMNAQMGTDYPIEKMVNWCFDRGSLRGWGSIVGKWGSFDVSGLIGEANDQGNDYAFLMNGMQQAAALVPLVRYDKRFAKAIGKWMLNLTNASRLFYPGFLPSSLQDGSAWSQVHDPNSSIAHEAMKEKFQNLTPFATGDAVGGGWAATNLAVYGSSSVGYLGAIVQKTNVDRILQLDLNTTDFYSETAYSTFLYYNPFDTPKSVMIDLGIDNFDIYETLSENFIHQNVSGPTMIFLPPKQAVIIVMTPVDGTISYDKNKMLVNGVVVDYGQSKVPFSYSPRIKALEPESYIVEKGTSIEVFCTAYDKDSDSLSYEWSTNLGVIQGDGKTVDFTAPQLLGPAGVKVIVSDKEGNQDSLMIIINIVEEVNKAPKIINLLVSEKYCSPGQMVDLVCEANDPNGDELTYVWSVNGGNIIGSGSEVQFLAPLTEGIYIVTVTVDDGRGLSTTQRVSILVKIFDGEGKIIAWYPFTGNSNDISGNEHNGNSKGALLTSDFAGNFNRAYYFNGGSQHIEVQNTSKLNVTNSISVSLWMKPILTADKELFLVSHGSWQNRWKVSITPTNQLRWTMNTLVGIVDLDIDFPLHTDSIYHVLVTYDGKNMAVYVNGQLNNFSVHSGSIRTTSLPLLIGQMLPSDANYNFKGVLDDVRIYDYALSPVAVNQLFQGGVTKVVDNTILYDFEIYPNPTSRFLNIKNTDHFGVIQNVVISDIFGKEIMTIAPPSEKEIDLGWLVQGYYYITIKTDSGIRLKTLQFIKL